MKFFKAKWDKQNNSVKLLLKKLKRHDTVVVAIAVVIALLLCGGLIYISTPVVTANAKEEFAESEKESKQATSDKLDELSEYLNDIDKSIEDSQNDFESFYKLTQEDKSNEKLTEKVTEKVSTIGGGLKELGELVSSTQTEITNLKELIEKADKDSMEAINKEFSSVSGQLSELKSLHEKTQSDNKTNMKELKDLINSENTKHSEELNKRFNELEKTIATMDKSFNTNLETLISELNDGLGQKLQELSDLFDNRLSNLEAATSSNYEDLKNQANNNYTDLKDSTSSSFEDLKNQTNNNYSDLKNSTNSSYAQLNTTINNRFDVISSTSENNTDELRELITQNVGEINTKLDQVFQYVSDGKKLLASALLTKGMTVKEDATFEEFSEAIRNIPQQIVLGNGDVAGKVEYEYHFHTDGAGNECNEDFVGFDRKGGCYTKPYYHSHTMACYSVVTEYHVRTDGGIDHLGPTGEKWNGEPVLKFYCPTCGSTYYGTNGWHTEIYYDSAKAHARSGWVNDTRTKYVLNCKYKEGQQLGFSTACGCIHGQVIKAHITFGPEYEDYDSTVDVPKGAEKNTSTYITTSHVMVPENSIDIEALMKELGGATFGSATFGGESEGLEGDDIVNNEAKETVETKEDEKAKEAEKAGEIKEPQKEPDSLSKPGKVEGTSAPQPEVKEQKNTESLGDHEVKEPVTENTESPKEVTMESSQAEDASLKSAEKESDAGSDSSNDTAAHENSVS